MLLDLMTLLKSNIYLDATVSKKTLAEEVNICILRREWMFVGKLVGD